MTNSLADRITAGDMDALDVIAHAYGQYAPDVLALVARVRTLTEELAQLRKERNQFAGKQAVAERRAADLSARVDEADADRHAAWDHAAFHEQRAATAEAAVNDLAAYADHENDCPRRTQMVDVSACSCGFSAVIDRYLALCAALATRTENRQ